MNSRPRDCVWIYQGLARDKQNIMIWIINFVIKYSGVTYSIRIVTMLYAMFVLIVLDINFWRLAIKVGCKHTCVIYAERSWVLNAIINVPLCGHTHDQK